jgi:hypothetical protein
MGAAIHWDTRSDTFTAGQRFQGRLYERRCDLSADGELLLYFAATMRPPLYSWTAVSRPPWFTALALWPKGDCWNGGGWFVGGRDVRINHPPDEIKLDPQTSLGPLRVAGHAEWRGEDDTVWDITRERDGWRRTAPGDPGPSLPQSGWDHVAPECWEKPHPSTSLAVLEMRITGLGLRGGAWYRSEYLVRHDHAVWHDLGRADWAEWASVATLFSHAAVFFTGNLSHLRSSPRHSSSPTSTISLSSDNNRRRRRASGRATCRLRRSRGPAGVAASPPCAALL